VRESKREKTGNKNSSILTSSEIRSNRSERKRTVTPVSESLLKTEKEKRVKTTYEFIRRKGNELKHPS